MRRICIIYSPVLFIGILLFASCKGGKTEIELQNEKVLKIIAAQSDSINATKFFPDKDVRKYLHKEFDEFYESRNYGLAWVDFAGPLQTSEELLVAIDNADKEGLDPKNYNLGRIEKLLKSTYKLESKKQKRKHKRAKRSLDNKVRTEAWEKDTLKLYDLVRLDFLMTSTYLTYASHLLNGKINPNETELWFSKPRKRDLSAHLEKAIKTNSIAKSLEDLFPKNQQYVRLRKELLKMNELLQADSIDVPLTKFESNENLKWKLVANKLGAWGDLPANDSSTTFNENLSEGLKSLQLRHGLNASGKLDAPTLAILNESIKAKVEKLKINLERMRWLPDDFGDKYILVNIPEFKMRLYERDKKTLEMKVIVGTNYNMTPVFSDSMEYIVFNPTWTVPNKIAIKEFLPKIKENPDFFKENNYQVYDSWKKDAEPIDCSTIDWKAVDSTNFSLRIVESPGEKNSLGRVKFMFPNNLDVYLHDTPGHGLFNAVNRSFSHGCVRLERPLDLAAHLLEEKGWDRRKIGEHINENLEPKTVNLPKKLPVHIVYWTAWVDEDNKLNFRKDVYKHDKFQEREIKKKEALL